MYKHIFVFEKKKKFFIKSFFFARILTHLFTNYFIWSLNLFFSCFYFLYSSKLGLQSLPVAFGIEKAKWLTVATIDITQVAVAGYLFYIGETTYALVLLGLIAPQVFFQFKFFLPDPVANDVKYQASAQPFLVFGILATALAVGHHGPL